MSVFARFLSVYANSCDFYGLILAIYSLQISANKITLVETSLAPLLPRLHADILNCLNRPQLGRLIQLTRGHYNLIDMGTSKAIYPFM